jgi:hypothetical protein
MEKGEGLQAQVDPELFRVWVVVVHPICSSRQHNVLERVDQPEPGKGGCTPATR